MVPSYILKFCELGRVDHIRESVRAVGGLYARKPVYVYPFHPALIRRDRSDIGYKAQYSQFKVFCYAHTLSCRSSRAFSLTRKKIDQHPLDVSGGEAVQPHIIVKQIQNFFTGEALDTVFHVAGFEVSLVYVSGLYLVSAGLSAGFRTIPYAVHAQEAGDLSLYFPVLQDLKIAPVSVAAENIAGHFRKVPLQYQEQIRVRVVGKDKAAQIFYLYDDGLGTFCTFYIIFRVKGLH